MPSPLPPASEILARVRLVYRECAAYEDTGEVTSTFDSGARGRRRTTIRPFATAFVRPDRFRFEFTEVGVGPEEEWKRYVIWNDGSGCRSWWTVRPQVTKHDSIRHAIGAAAGVSGRSSSRVPVLLFAMHAQPSLEHDALGGTATTDGVECFRLRIPFGDLAHETWWIARDTFLIHRVEMEHLLDAESRAQSRRATEQMLASDEIPEAMKIRVRQSLEQRAPLAGPDVRVTNTTTYRPALDPSIEPERFEFTPPFVGPAAWDNDGAPPS